MNVNGEYMSEDEIIDLACELSEMYDNSERTLENAVQVLRENEYEVEKE